MAEPIFVSQFGTREAVEDRIKNKDNEDLNEPEWNWCGLCCVRMIALGLELDPPDLSEMYHRAFDQYQVFKMIDGELIGAYHRELASYIEAEFGLSVTALRHQTVEDVAKLLEEGNYFIASVSAEIRKLDGQEPKKRNGHFVLVWGVERTQSGDNFIIHNSSGFQSLKTQEAVRVPVERFAACFSGNGITVSSDRS
ncbi:MAG: C39 family peptidase [Patescibacteria group bacterium]